MISEKVVLKFKN